MIKLMIIAKKDSIHTIRWVNALAKFGYEIHLISCHDNNEKINSNIQYYNLGKYTPFCYFYSVFRVKKLIKKIRPDLVHAHYASGYGVIARYSGFHPLILSVWGSDVYNYPNKNILNKYILKKNLKSADLICSTSYAMSEQTKKYIKNKRIEIVPFGIDTNKFKERNINCKNTIVIGTVKTLEYIYGIDVLIKAFSVVVNNIRAQYPELLDKIKLTIVGAGSKLDEYTKLTQELNITEYVIFTGQVPHSEVIDYLHNFDIFVAVSRSESFGVSVIEASATGLPVIVSDVGGLPEVVKNSETGIIVKPEDYLATADAIIKLILDKTLRKQMGLNGRAYVEKKYKWSENVKRMHELYREIIEKQDVIKTGNNSERIKS